MYIVIIVLLKQQWSYIVAQFSLPIINTVFSQSAAGRAGTVGQSCLCKFEE